MQTDFYDLAMPFISLCPAGGRNRSPYCESASRSERDTSIDVVVVQSTSNGNKPINCSHATLSTVRKWKKIRKKVTKKKINLNEIQK